MLRRRSSKALRDAVAAVSYPVVAFDLDGTLLRGTTASLFLAEVMGHGKTVQDLERRFHAGEISNTVVADISAAWFEGWRREEIWAQLERAPWIGGIAETLGVLADSGCHLLLATVTWRFVAEMLANRYPFEEICGTEMSDRLGVLSGRVSSYFDEHDKLRSSSPGAVATATTSLR